VHTLFLPQMMSGHAPAASRPRTCGEDPVGRRPGGLPDRPVPAHVLAGRQPLRAKHDRKRAGQGTVGPAAQFTMLASGLRTSDVRAHAN
jgi:hypothetical protein